MLTSESVFTKSGVEDHVRPYHKWLILPTRYLTETRSIATKSVSYLKLLEIRQVSP